MSQKEGLTRKAVGLDLSIAGSGMTVVGFNGVYCWSTRVQTIPGGLEVARYREVANTLLENTDPNDAVFVEDYAFGKVGKGGTNNITRLGELGGVVKTFAWLRNKKPVMPISSSTIKKWASGSGNLPKDKMPLAVYKKWGVEFPDNDQTFSLALADLGYHIINPESPKRKLAGYEKDVIASLYKKHGDDLGSLLV